MKFDAATVRAAFPIVRLATVATATIPPNFTSLDKLQIQLNENAMSVPSTGGNGALGLLSLVMTDAELALLDNYVAFVPPVNPPDLPVLQGDWDEHAQQMREHKVQQELYQQYIATRAALLFQMTEVIPDIYLRSLRHPRLGYANTTPIALLAMLWENYGRITPRELDDNRVRMTTLWNFPDPIQLLFVQLEDGVSFSAAALEPMPDSVVTRMGHNIIEATGRFEQACREWRMNPVQTMLHFQSHFLQADTDLRMTMTTAQAGFHGDAANAAATAPADTRRAPRNPEGGPLTYCWTHGLSNNVEHTSETCQRRSPGHLEAATATNRLGGSERVWTGRSRA
jgi:hypothetical protein